MNRFFRRLKQETGISLIELILGLIIFVIVVSGIILVLSKGIETFFFEREEVLVQGDMRNVMDRITDKLRQATSVTTAEPTNIIFDPDSRSYYWDSESKSIYDVNGDQLNSQEIEVTNFSFFYYGEDITTPLSFPVDASEIKAVGIEMEFQKDDNPTLQLKNWVLMRNLL